MGLSKLWGKDSAGEHGFVFSHIKTIYYNWAQKKLLSTKLDEMDTDTESRLEKSKTLDDYASIMSNQTSGFWPDALAVKEGFTQLNTDIGNRIRCIRDTPLLTDVPAGYSEQSVSLSNISGTVVGTAVRVTSYASGGGYLCVTLNGSNAWIEAEKAQQRIKLEVLRFYTS